MNRFENKVVLITGAGSGMGAEYGRAFAAEGAKVVLGDVNEENVKKVAEEIGKNAIGLKMDVSSWEDWKQVMEAAHEKFGKVAVLINNAGIADQTPFEYLTEEAFRRSFEVNTMSVFYGCKAVLEDMKELNWGRIVNISSIAGLRGSGDNAAYVASKHAVTGITKSNAYAFAKYNILINGIHPGAVDTPMIRTLDEKFPGTLQYLANSIPLKRLGDCSEIARLALFLASEENTFMTGEGIVIDGGQFV